MATDRHYPTDFFFTGRPSLATGRHWPTDVFGHLPTEFGHWPTEFGQWLANGWPMIGQWLANDWPMVGQWLADGGPMVGQWLANGWAMVGRLLANGWPMGGQWLDTGWPMVATNKFGEISNRHVAQIKNSAKGETGCFCNCLALVLSNVGSALAIQVSKADCQISQSGSICA